MENSQTAKKKDFIELEFLGKNLTSGEIFDTNVLEEAKKINPDIKDVKPLVVCIGEGFVVKGLDEFLEGKEIGKKYSVKIESDKGFGKRNPQLIRLIPMKMFLAQKIYPQAGMTLALDNSLVKVVNVSGGRVMVDFNNPLAGKDLEYDFTIKKVLADTKEKVNAIQNFFFGQQFEFDVDESAKKIIFKDMALTEVLNVFRPKFKDILGFDVEILAKKEKKEEAKVEEKKEEVK